jgi:hypothetical protein
MDFTLNTYKALLETLLAQGFLFQPFINFIQTPANRVIILRHDVDRRPRNALNTAQLEHDLGIPASYYFRAMPESWDEAIIRELAGLGHEIGYHYEDLSLCHGDYEAAINQFKKNLAAFRQLYPVKTICMHGSPMSKWDNRDLWKKYDYRGFGIIAEPYFDVDFNEVFYLTDTGRRWDGNNFSVRDKVDKQWCVNRKLKSTMDIIAAVKAGDLPDKIMITTHPQRWDGLLIPWTKELVWQNIKNMIKQLIIKSGK